MKCNRGRVVSVPPINTPRLAPPSGESAIGRKQLELSITDMDIFKDIIQIIIELMEDRSVDKNIRMKYFDKLAKAIDLEGYHIDL